MAIFENFPPNLGDIFRVFYTRWGFADPKNPENHEKWPKFQILGDRLYVQPNLGHSGNYEMWGNPQKQSKNAGSTDFRFLTSRPARGAEFSGISAPRAPRFSVLEGSRNSGPDRSPDLDFWAPGPATPRGQRLGGPRVPWTGFRAREGPKPETRQFKTA